MVLSPLNKNFCIFGGGANALCLICCSVLIKSHLITLSIKGSEMRDKKTCLNKPQKFHKRRKGDQFLVPRLAASSRSDPHLPPAGILG